MKPEELRALLERVAAGDVSVTDARHSLETLPFEDLGFANVDHHRELRTGFPEVVYGPGKTDDQVAEIVRSITKRGQPALVTRLPQARSRDIVAMLDDEAAAKARIEAVPGMLFVGDVPLPGGRGVIAVVSAGTSDAPVAEEAACTAELLGNEVVRMRDVGVAGLHRLVPYRQQLESAEVVIVVAGMEGALPSVVSGLISRPVIAVPTSIGHGASFGGVAALLAMLNSCASGVTVVNIDNGFGAGYAAALINAKRPEKRAH